MSTNQLADRCDFNAGDRIDGQYVVRKSLGGGSFGAVYLVDDQRHRQQLALKLLRLWEVPAEIREPLKQRFRMEYDTGQIDCENLVRSLTYGNVKGNPYIVMEYCPGGDLQPYLGQDPSRVPDICRDILVGLDALHARGKVHRDLKPENVLFKKDGKAALTDFGIVGDRTHRMTQRNIFGRPDQIFGTYAYMPPEQAGRARGGATVLPTTDIFSFGVLAYQLLTGQLPFGQLESHNDLASYLQKGKEGSWNRSALRRIADGDRWERLLGACLEADFHQRLQSAREALSMLPRGRGGQQPVYHLAQSDYAPSAVTRGYRLRVLQGEEYGRSYDLAAPAFNGKGLLTIGRHEDNDIYIKSDFGDFISRRHCTLEHPRDGWQWVVRDGQWNPQERQWNDSRNGTYVNSRPVGPHGFYLKAGDILTLGDVTLRFENY